MDCRYVDLLTGKVMYTVKYKRKSALVPYYASMHITESINDIKEKKYPLKWFLLTLSQARELIKTLQMRQDQDYEYLSIVRLSTYEPFGEYAVIEYREFK